MPAAVAAARIAPAPSDSQADLFEKLTAIIAHEWGQYTPERQLSAYLAFISLHINDGPDATQAQLDAVAASSTGAQARGLQIQAAEMMRQAEQSGGDAAEGAGAFYNALSAFQENMVFRIANMKLPDPADTWVPGVADAAERAANPFLLYAETMVGLFVAFPLPGQPNAAAA